MKLTLADIGKIKGILAIVLPTGKFPRQNVLQLKNGNHCLYFKSNEWNVATENFIFKTIKKHFRVEPAFWGNSKTLEAATRKAKGLGGALIVEHPSPKKKRVFTLYILG